MDQPLTGPVLFRTERLTVRRLAAGDVEDLLAVYGDREVVRWVDDGEPLTRADAERWVEVTDRNFARRGRGMAALVLTATGEVVGFCGIVRPGDQEEDEVKYALRRDRWGQGLATEVVEAMLDHAERRFGLGRIIATVAAENRASLRVLEKVGMRPLGERLEDDGSVTRVLVWRADGSPT